MSYFFLFDKKKESILKNNINIVSFNGKANEITEKLCKKPSKRERKRELEKKNKQINEKRLPKYTNHIYTCTHHFSR